jgi:hypothetical protein
MSDTVVVLTPLGKVNKVEYTIREDAELRGVHAKKAKGGDV